MSGRADGSPPQSYAEREKLASLPPGAARRKRLYLAGWQGADSESRRFADRWIPEWERLYLGGLTSWRHGEFEEAAARLQSALALAPLQTPVRLALASLQAVVTRLKALQTLSLANPSREVLVAMAAIMARQGRYEEAQSALRKRRCTLSPAESRCVAVGRRDGRNSVGRNTPCGPRWRSFARTGVPRDACAQRVQRRSPEDSPPGQRTLSSRAGSSDVPTPKA